MNLASDSNSKTDFKSDAISFVGSNPILVHSCRCFNIYFCGYNLMVEYLTSTQIAWVQIPLLALAAILYIKNGFGFHV